MKQKLRLADLPVEIICQIADNLDEISTALFALSSRWLLEAIGRSALAAMDSSNYPEKTYDFLRLLEKGKNGILDGDDDEGRTLCPYCARFHSPYKSTVRWNGDVFAWDRSYRCRRRTADGILGGGFTVALPRRLTFNMIHAMTTRHRLGHDVSNMLRQMNWTLTRADVNRASGFVTSTQISYRCKIVTMDGGNDGKGCGRLLVRTHNVWCPHVGGADEVSRQQLTGLYYSLSLSKGGPWPEGRMDGICQHVSWSHAFPGGFLQGDSPAAGRRLGRTDMQPRIRCAVFHHPQPCSLRCGLGEVRGCPDCLVDYAVSAVWVPGLGPALVFTTWDDLGCPSVPADLKCARHPTMRPHHPASGGKNVWRKHRRLGRFFSGAGREESETCSSAAVGDTFASFEGWSGIRRRLDAAARRIYVPKLSRRDVERIKVCRDNVLRKSFHEGHDTYSDIPEPSACTGLLEHPDPLDD